MKTTLLRLIAITMAAFPLIASAQTNIKKAFDSLINNSKAQITDTHALENNPQTKVKTGQYDIYYFVLPSSQINIVESVVNAIEKDSGMAYSFIGGDALNGGGHHGLVSGVGEEIVFTVDEPGCKFAYALFLAPASEDPNGIYRYAYAINYREKNGKIEGKLIISYATTLAYRQQLEQAKQGSGTVLSYGGNVINNIGAAYSKEEYSQSNWFNSLMWYVSSMENADNKKRILYATNAHKIINEIGKYSNVTELEKNSAREIFKVLISKKENSDPILNTLLRQCLNGIK